MWSIMEWKISGIRNYQRWSLDKFKVPLLKIAVERQWRDIATLCAVQVCPGSKKYSRGAVMSKLLLFSPFRGQ